MKNLKGVSWRALTLLLIALALASVSAAPSSPVVASPKRGAAAYPRTAPPLSSVSKLRQYIATLKNWGREHKTRVKTGYLEAYLYRLQHLAYPSDTVDWNRYAAAVGQRSRLPASSIGAVRRRGPLSAQALEPVSWEYVGPSSLAVPYQTYYGEGALSGRVNGVAYDPVVAGTYWVATAGGGVWKSVDSGQTWTFLSAAWPALETSCVTVHPTNRNVVYVGTGDFHGVGGFYGFGIMKTTDGGQTWTNLGGAQFGDMSVSEIVVDPENPDIVLVATGRGRDGQGKLWRSVDGGQSWTAVIATLRHWTGLSVGALSGGDRYYWAVGSGDDSDVWRSADRGATWTKLGLTLADGYYAGLGVAASRIHPDTAYLISGPDRKIYKTTDAGAVWTNITAGVPTDLNPGDQYNWSQSWYDWHITTSVNGAQDVVYVGLIDLVVSPDGGSTWRSAGATYSAGALTHNDQHCLAVNPSNPNESLVGNDGGVYRMSYTPSSGAVVFNTTLNAGLGITQFLEADFHPTDPTRMIGGTQDNATPVALGDLGAWKSVCGGDGCGCAINPVNPNIQYASEQYQRICRTGDQWSSEQVDISPDWGADDVPFVGRMTLDPSNPNLLYAGTDYLWRWNEPIGTWTPRLGGADLAGGGSSITAIAVAPSSSSVIYTGSGAGDVYRSSNGGARWTRINTGSPALPSRAVMSIAVDPTDPNAILVGLSGTGAAHLWRCADSSRAGRAWTNIGVGLPDVPVNAVVIDPTGPASRFYVGTDLGVFTTVNGGASWENATAPRGLPNVIVNELKLVPGTGYLMAATYGRGMWRLDVRLSALTVTAPNGGELWGAGSTRHVTWSSAGTLGDVKLEYSADNGENWTVISQSTPNDGSEPWVLPTALTTESLVRVTSVSEGAVTDVSDGKFTIRYEGGMLKVGAKVNFGAVKVGKSRQRSLKVTNISRTQDLTLSVSAPSGPFQLLASSGPYTIRPRKSLLIPLVYTPPSKGPNSTTLTITSSDPARPSAVVIATGKGK